MGEPVRIVDMAHMWIDRSNGGDIEIVYTGLRAGDEMNEELFGDDEPQDARPAHPLVSHVQVLSLALRGEAVMLHRFNGQANARVWIKAEFVASFVPLPAMPAGKSSVALSSLPIS